MKQNIGEEKESARGLKSPPHTDLLPRKEKRKCSIGRFGLIVLAILLPYLLILMSIGPYLVQALQQTQGFAPKHTYISMLLFCGIILFVALRKYCPYITK
jgi:hypothetical protein